MLAWKIADWFEDRATKKLQREMFERIEAFVSINSRFTKEKLMHVMVRTQEDADAFNVALALTEKKRVVWRLTDGTYIRYDSGCPL
ncbi:hypothetical protein [Rhizobium phage RHEph12]|nr:hypothetical protein [Rhizobium phage RHEph12]